MDQTKRCALCKETKPVGEFGRDRHRSDGLNYRCKECVRPLARAAQARDYARNSEQRRADSQAYRDANRDKVRAANRTRNRARYAADPSAWLAPQRAAYAADPDTKCARSKAWRKANPGWVIADHARKRGAKVVDFFTLDELREHLRSFGIDPDLCMYCHTAPREEWDHILALCLGGQHVLANMAPSCARCNRRKGRAEQWVSQGLAG